MNSSPAMIVALWLTPIHIGTPTVYFPAARGLAMSGPSSVALAAVRGSTWRPGLAHDSPLLHSRPANPATDGEAGVDLGGAAEVVQGLARP